MYYVRGFKFAVVSCQRRCVDFIRAIHKHTPPFDSIAHTTPFSNPFLPTAQLTFTVPFFPHLPHRQHAFAIPTRTSSPSSDVQWPHAHKYMTHPLLAQKVAFSHDHEDMVTRQRKSVRAGERLARSLATCLSGER